MVTRDSDDLRQRMAAHPPERIYMRIPNWVGDSVMATAAMARVRRAWPQAELLGAGRPYLESLLTGPALPAGGGQGARPLFDRWLPTPKSKGLLGRWSDIRTEARAVRAFQPDLAIVLPNSWVTGVIPWLAGVPVRLGYTQGRPGLMTHGLRATPSRRYPWQRMGPRRVPDPMPLYYNNLLDLLGIPEGGEHPFLSVADEDDAWLAGWFRDKGLPDPDGAACPSIALITAGASYGASKLWMPERFAQVARYFRDQGMLPLILSGPKEAPLADRIAKDGGAVSTTDPVLPLGALKALMRRAAILVTGDTGPRHLAVAFDVPTVCLIGPNDRRYTDYCLERQEVIQKDLPCIPCQRKVCPLKHNRCMKDITVDEVLSAAKGMLERFPQPA